MVYQPTSRVLTVLELLQTHGQMTARALASRLEVDPRTVRRYVTTLQDMGIPIESEPGRYGGYALHPGYKLPPLMFSNDEVLVLTLGLQMARQAGLMDAGTAVESALAKIGRVLPEALRDQLQALQASMQLGTAQAAPGVDAQTVTLLSMASQQCRQVRLAYAAGTGSTTRTFDPYSVIHHDNHWYAVGYCHLRDALRTFRLDRVESVSLLNTPFVPPAGFDALNYMLASFEAIPDRWNIDVLLEMPLEAARQKMPRPLATIVQEGERVRLRASMPDLDEMARLLLTLGCPLTVVEPQELRDAFLRLANAIQQMMCPAAETVLSGVAR